MFEHPVRNDSGPSVDENLRARLARSDALAETVQPILRHLLVAENGAIFSDEILARIRGSVSHLAQQLLGGKDFQAIDQLSTALLDQPALLTHLHAQALEWQLGTRLEEQAAVEPVVPPLLQALMSSSDTETKALATMVLSAQAQWSQAQRRMQLPVAGLPGEILHQVLIAGRKVSRVGEAREAEIRGRYDEGASRLSLAARLLIGLGSGAPAALDLRHAGLSLFLSALAIATEQERDTVILATHEAQVIRMALSLIAAGLDARSAERQMLLLHRDLEIPGEIRQITPQRARLILADLKAPGA